jgi:acetyltransferase-like isoleucine patch superfamily enzyme
MDLGYTIDPLAKVARSVQIGNGSAIWAFASVHGGVIIGEMVGVGEHTYIGRDTRIGDRTRISQGVHITDHMLIGENVFIAPHVVFANDKHPKANNPNYKLNAPVVEDNVSIGTNATIMPGVRLGKGCIVGAGAVVVKDVAPYVIVVGNPAKELNKNA